jgi:hypothetical protein
MVVKSAFSLSACVLNYSVEGSRKYRDEIILLKVVPTAWIEPDTIGTTISQKRSKRIDLLIVTLKQVRRECGEIAE